MARRSLENRRAIVTGASSGIGRSLAIGLARKGVRLILVARRGELLEQVCAEAGGATPVIGDITDPALRRRTIERANAELGGLDLLINNAGASAQGRFADADPTRLARILEVNFLAAAELVRLAIPALRQGDQAAIVNVGSILGYRGAPFNSEYCASKFALRGWSEAIRSELVADGIDVLLITPGTTDTEFLDHLLEKQGEMPWRRAQGMAADAVARDIIQGLQRRRREITPGWRAKAFVGATRLAPTFVRKIMDRYGKLRK